MLSRENPRLETESTSSGLKRRTLWALQSTGALSLGVNLLSREGNSQKWRMKDTTLGSHCIFPTSGSFTQRPGHKTA